MPDTPPPTVNDPPTPDDLEALRQWSLARRADLSAQADAAAAATNMIYSGTQVIASPTRAPPA
jgi:hypothetical protein